MDLGQIQLVSKQALERAELQSSCDELYSAHRSLVYFERRLARSKAGLADARIRLSEAQKRMDGILEKIQRNLTS